MRQKRSLVINDLSGVGRCSLSAILPILAIFDNEVLNVPTAVLSSSTQYPGFVMNDMSDYVPKYLKQYDDIGYEFDGCLVGFLGNASVIASLEEYLSTHKFPIMLIDPIMGDNGKLYKTYTKELVDGVRRLCKYADLITPNLTEFYALIEKEYDAAWSEETLIEGCQKLGNKMIVVTGIEQGDKVGNFIYQNGTYSYYYREKSAASRSGTGDVYSAVVFGALQLGYSLEDAVKLGADFVYDALIRSDEVVEDYREGLAFEGLLGGLYLKLKSNI